MFSPIFKKKSKSNPESWTATAVGFGRCDFLGFLTRRFPSVKSVISQISLSASSRSQTVTVANDNIILSEPGRAESTR